MRGLLRLGDATRTGALSEPLFSNDAATVQKTMGTTTQSIDVNVPLRAVYDQWTRFEEFPHFMEGVEEIRKDGPKKLFWRVNIGGIQKQWEAEITAEFPDRLIAWQSVDGTPNSGKVDFAAIDAESTLITVHMEYEPEG